MSPLPDQHPTRREADLRLDLAVSSLEGKPLLPAGTLVDSGVIAELTAAGRANPWPFATLLGHGTVRRDSAHSIREGQYATIFGSEDQYRDLERLMGTVQVPEPCLRGLDVLRERDYYIYRHILMVFALSCLLAQRLGHDGEETTAGILAGPLHDFGKLCVPTRILEKSTPLLHSERAILEQHTLAGHVLLSYYFGGSDHFTSLVARDHHERRDCSGYPRGIALSDPLMEIVAVCDIYDALISPRPYRLTSFDNRSALEEITTLAERGTLGWDVVKLLISLNRKNRPAPELVDISARKRGHRPEGSVYGVFEDDLRLS
jgi:HD-GYP domain-containing protein (c-di-GMP phosphodiesterase class II)